MQLTHYNWKNHVEDQKSFIASQLIPVQLKAGEEILWTNNMLNSPFGACPLRFAAEAESHGTLLSIFLSFCFAMCLFFLQKM